jgi:hypothetical protein
MHKGLGPIRPGYGPDSGCPERVLPAASSKQKTQTKKPDQGSGFNVFAPFIS